MVRCRLSSSFFENIATLPSITTLMISEYAGLPDDLLPMCKMKIPPSIYIVQESEKNTEYDWEQIQKKYDLNIQLVSSYSVHQGKMLWLHPFCIVDTNYIRGFHRALY